MTVWTGTVTTGCGNAAASPGWFTDGWHPGTLNLAPLPDDPRLVELGLVGARPDGWGERVWSEHLRLHGRIVKVRGVPVDPVPVIVGEYGHTELLAVDRLRDVFGLVDGDTVTVDIDAIPVKVVVAVPWRPTPERQAAHDFAAERLRCLLPAAEYIEVDTGHRPYNLAAARNLAFVEAERRGADVVAVIDADTVYAPGDALHRAIAAAASGDGRLHMAHTAAHYCTPAETEAIYDGNLNPLPGIPHNGGGYIATPAVWQQIGGQDERFTGWGGEDDQLIACAETLAGLVRHWGTVLSLHHADAHRPVGTAEHRPNARLAHRYWDARGNPAAIHRIIAEREAPHVPAP